MRRKSTFSSEDVNSLGRFVSSVHRANSLVSIESTTNRDRSYFQNSEEIIDERLYIPTLQGKRLSIVLQAGEIDALREGVLSESNNTLHNHEVALERTPLLPQDSYKTIESQDRDDITVEHFQDSNGKTLTIVKGRSTLPQTVFNSVNALIGIGLLALPLGFKLCGWVIGASGLTICAILTYYSATLLSKCMDTDRTLMTYSDLAYETFGSKGRAIISFSFSLELLAGGISLIVLFADSLNALFPSISIIQFKLLAFLILTPSSFLPLNILSFISLLGIASTISVVLVIFVAGLIKNFSPGSLLDFLPTNLFPETHIGPLVSIGILMAPFGGHAIFPSLKADMRHPYRFENSLKLTFVITYLTDIAMAVIGFLMFGANVLDEVTKNIIITAGYPKWVYVFVCALMAIVPFSKVPLNARPIITTIDYAFNVTDISYEKDQRKKLLLRVLKIVIKLSVNASFVITAILFPSFEKIIAMVGSGLCILLCLIFPCSFYLTICKDQISAKEKLFNQAIILVSILFAIVGTIAAVSY